MAWTTWVKGLLQGLSIVCLLAGMALTFAGMFGSDWQIADFGKGYIHYHGLWKDCEANSPVKIGGTNDLVCWYKFDQDNQNSRHPFTSWQLTTMALLGTSASLALIGAILACLSCCIKFCSIGWVVLCCFASLGSGSGLFVYYRWSSENTNRIEMDAYGAIATQYYGTSFYLAVGGLAMFLVATVFSILCSALIFYAARNQHSNKTWPKNIQASHNTVV